MEGSESEAVFDACNLNPQRFINEGVAYLRNMTQEILDKRMNIWEKYCLRHCFAVPEGFVLQNAKDLSLNNLSLQEGDSEAELDSHLNYLREKLTEVGRESSELHREIQALEKQTSLHNSYDASIAEALQLCEQNSAHEMFQVLVKALPCSHDNLETFVLFEEFRSDSMLLMVFCIVANSNARI
ncbi:hypothetical protein J5N97_024309 [Dioscorea zingiberensis]|uniref:Uncharacterized protein n=1 Tax=Dioscorea zingiberensis TaxID=325984 RepID=A0A9D5C7G9_9LILI|nr:hypothetical protein J5N97_024309 [Dioscorea zingiberensis]